VQMPYLLRLYWYTFSTSDTFLFLFLFCIGTKEALDHVANYSLSRETTSQLGIEPPTTPLCLGTSPLSSSSLQSSWTTSDTCCKAHDHALYNTCLHNKDVYILEFI